MPGVHRSAAYILARRMRFVDVIARKRDGLPLTPADIDLFVDGVTTGSVPDYQASALLMAILLRGMTDEETAWLTDAMVRSGDRIDLSDIPGVKVGKHSTGGVGDKVSLVLAPLAAACGVVVPKMSGRGLGYTGGTLDKLESIPGFRIGLTIDEFKSVLRQVGTCVIGQTGALAPADKKLYALRDVTGTVESIPLISASIMSKKIAEGIDALVLDVKTGSGGFMKTEADSRRLAESLVSIGNASGVKTEAFITDMDAPLGSAVGNALEIIESIETLRGKGPADLAGVVVHLAARMLILADVESTEAAARRRLEAALASGHALETFARMIELQGGNRRVVEDYSLLPAAPSRQVLTAPRGGFVSAVRAEAIGRASHALGAGRDKVGDPIDHAVGLKLLVQPGTAVSPGQPLIEFHHRDGLGLEQALALGRAAVTIADEAPPARRKVIGEVR
jgi:pyrimidine-nucleoside phosphorylase